MKLKALLVSGGNLNDFDLLLKLVGESDFVLCADGGVKFLLKIGVLPDLVIGDFDSIDEDSLNVIEENNIEIIKFPVIKNETDTELAVNYLLERNCSEITLIGATGTRLDHSLGNIFLLKKINDSGVFGRLVDGNNIVYYGRNNIKIRKEENYYASIIPLCTYGVRVTLKGFLYPLENHHIEFGSTLGISNEIVDEYGIIDTIEGECLIIYSKD